MITPFLLNGFKKSVLNAGGVLYLDARKATGFRLPSNSPLTSPWVDLSDNDNDATPTNFAGNMLSGVDISNLLRPSWVLDGSDDFFNLSSTSSLDINTAPLAIFVTLKVSIGSGYGYIISKNLDSSANVQYALTWDNANKRVVVKLENSDRVSTITNSIQETNWYNVGFIWDGTNVKTFINGISNNSGAYSGTLTSRPNLRIGRRETAASHFKGNIATATVYTGEKAIEANILKSERLISKAYIS